MISHRRINAWIVGLAVTALVLGGCARREAQTPPAQQQAVEVQVTLTDFKIEATQTEFAAGTPYRFVITNRGAVAHEFMIVPPMMGHMTMDEMDRMAVAMIEEDELPPGTARTLEYTFTKSAPAGQLEFACHVEGHYEAGMHVPIVVR
jgi:uncharacterized cupredoxin-like copper-binding protein